MNNKLAGRPIRPVILAGGAGTRLWPLSTAARPKHLIPLLGDQCLFEETLGRFGSGFATPMVVANHAQEADLRALSPEGAILLLEPMKRDSAAAIAIPVRHSRRLIISMSPVSRTLSYRPPLIGMRAPVM